MAAKARPGATCDQQPRHQGEEMSDEINHPKHYQLFPDMEAIDLIKTVLTPDEFVGYLKGNALKYRLRAGDKGPAVKCIAKAHWYQNYLRNLAGEVRVEWPADDSRIDIIGQNGPDGAVYLAQGECDHDYEVAFDIKTLDGRVDGSLLRCAKCAATQIGGRNE